MCLWRGEPPLFPNPQYLLTHLMVKQQQQQKPLCYYFAPRMCLWREEPPLFPNPQRLLTHLMVKQQQKPLCYSFAPRMCLWRGEPPLFPKPQRLLTQLMVKQKQQQQQQLCYSFALRVHTPWSEYDMGNICAVLRPDIGANTLWFTGRDFNSKNQSCSVLTRSTRNIHSLHYYYADRTPLLLWPWAVPVGLLTCPRGNRRGGSTGVSSMLPKRSSGIGCHGDCWSSCTVKTQKRRTWTCRIWAAG